MDVLLQLLPVGLERCEALGVFLRLVGGRGAVPLRREGAFFRGVGAAGGVSGLALGLLQLPLRRLCLRGGGLRRCV